MFFGYDENFNVHEFSDLYLNCCPRWTLHLRQRTSCWIYWIRSSRMLPVTVSYKCQVSFLDLLSMKLKIAERLIVISYLPFTPATGMGFHSKGAGLTKMADILRVNLFPTFHWSLKRPTISWHASQYKKIINVGWLCYCFIHKFSTGCVQ